LAKIKMTHNKNATMLIFFMSNKLELIISIDHKINSILANLEIER